MSPPDQPKEGKIPVDFDEVTRIFVRLKPAIAKIKNVDQFVNLMQGANEKIFLKYFESSRQNLYEREDLILLVQHVIDCINNIMPDSFDYECIFDDNVWSLAPKEGKSKIKKPKPN